MSQAPAVLLLARAPRAGAVRQGVAEMLGPARAAALQAELVAAAARWAHAAAPGHVHLAHDPPDAAAELRDLAGGARLFPQHGVGIARRFADAAMRVFAQEGERPLLAIWPELPVWRASLAAGALADLREGADVVIGPLVDGGCYLIGLAGPQESLFAVPEATWRARDALRLGLAAVSAAGLELGLLRSERPLRRAGDVRAALADPCLPAAIADVLGG